MSKSILSNVYSMTDQILRKERKNVDRTVDAMLAELKYENTLLPETPIRILKRALKFYRQVRPAFALVIKLPIIPTTWTVVLEAFMRALDALAVPEVIGEITQRFKAGRDLAA